MKRKYSPYGLVLFMLTFFSLAVNSQATGIGLVEERMQVCTDRTTYASGEKIFFSALLFNAGDTAVNTLSRAFYCELITPRGSRITGRKYLLENSTGKGNLAIPEETLSGIYYLRFYTRFMRNNSTDAYKYIMLKIINPYKPEVISGNDAVDTLHPAAHRAALQGNVAVNSVSGKMNFNVREEIRLTITRKNVNDPDSRLCLSVIPVNTFGDPPFIQPVKRNDTSNVFYFPETRGISLSGQLVVKESRKPVPGAKVNLSIIGDRDILVVVTDSSGRFFFALPDYPGKMDIFLSADDLPDIIPEILIDNDFCSRPVNLPSPLFSLNEEENLAAYKMAVNARITSVFSQDTLHADSLSKSDKVSFYGAPAEVLLMEKFIDLPTLTEYFTELPGMVKLKKSHGKKQFRFYDAMDELSAHAPLLLVDWVAVNDIEKILAMSPAEIDRVELVNALYVKGNVTYGGIISFVSKKNNFAGIDLPTSGTFVNYTFLEEYSPEISAGPASPNIPDARNTVYWNPDVPAGQDGTTIVSFTAPDTPGNYWILLRQLMKNGEVATSREMITVTDQ